MSDEGSMWLIVAGQALAFDVEPGMSWKLGRLAVEWLQAFTDGIVITSMVTWSLLSYRYGDVGCLFTRSGEAHAWHDCGRQ